MLRLLVDYCDVDQLFELSFSLHPFTVDQNSSKQILSVDFEHNSETMNWSHVDYFWIIVMFVQNLLVNCVKKKKKSPQLKQMPKQFKLWWQKKHPFVWEILFL